MVGKYEFHRLAVVQFSSRPIIIDKVLEDLHQTRKGVKLKVLIERQLLGERKLTILVVDASIIAEYDLMLDDANVVFPNEIRIELEKQIELFADLASVFGQCSRDITSPTPCVAINALEETSRHVIAEKSISLGTEGIPIRADFNFDEEFELSLFVDRLDGVAILAEARQHEHPSGKIIEFTRFFERAFGHPAGNVLSGPLPKFLKRAEGNFSKEETTAWLKLRHELAHADSLVFALRYDSLPIANRMEFAAYDVFFNKTDWGTNSKTRRDICTPNCGSIAAKGAGMFVRQGRKCSIAYDMVDPFIAYSLDLRVCLKNLPKEWLTRGSNEKCD